MPTTSRLLKTYPVEVKAIGDQGIVEMLVSIFGNVDLIGDRVVKGAFQKSLADWNQSGDPIPFIWSHNWDDPNAHIGKVIKAQETDQGLLVRAQLDLDQAFAAQVYRLLKERRVKEASFAYDVVKEKRAKDGANDLMQLNLIEVGPTLKGMNPETALVGVKEGTTIVINNPAPEAEEVEAEEPALDQKDADAEFKAGRTISKANENKIRTAIDTLQEVLSSLEAEAAPKADEHTPVAPVEDELISLKAAIEELSI